MNKYTEYQSAVAQALASLPIGPDGEVYMTSLTNRQKGTIAGRVGINTAGVAAMLLAQGTHQPSTPDEIENWKREQALKKIQIEAEAAKKEGKINLDLNDFLTKFTAVISPAPATASAEPSSPQMSPAVQRGGNPSKHSTPAA